MFCHSMVSSALMAYVCEHDDTMDISETNLMFVMPVVWLAHGLRGEMH